MCRFALSALAAPGLLARVVGSMTHKKMRSTALTLCMKYRIPLGTDYTH